VSTSSESTVGAADRYAAALFDLAIEEKAVDAVEADLRTLRAAMQAAPDLHEVVTSPAIPAADKVPALQAVARRLGVSDLTVRFVGLLASNGRAALLDAVASGFLARASRARGEVIARVATAVPLDDAARDALARTLGKTLNAPVALETEVRPELVGGLVVQVGSRQYDASIRTKLDNLKLALKGA
jgi:F-type H+-transporting ATPase subunit delta